MVRKVPNRLPNTAAIWCAGDARRLPQRLDERRPIPGYFFQHEERARKSLLRLTPHWPEADRNSLALPEITDLFTASFVDAFRQGAKGPAYDGMVVRRPGGFELEAITFPALYLWHGELDTDVPVAMGRAVVERLA